MAVRLRHASGAGSVVVVTGLAGDKPHRQLFTHAFSAATATLYAPANQSVEFDSDGHAASVRDMLLGRK